MYGPPTYTYNGSDFTIWNLSAHNDDTVSEEDRDRHYRTSCAIVTTYAASIKSHKISQKCIDRIRKISGDVPIAVVYNDTDYVGDSDEGRSLGTLRAKHASDSNIKWFPMHQRRHAYAIAQEKDSLAYMDWIVKNLREERSMFRSDLNFSLLEEEIFTMRS